MIDGKLKIVSKADAEYDACYYEVWLDEKVKEDNVPTKLNVKITKKSADVDAYIYGGPSRIEAKTSLVPGNAQVTVG